MKSLRKRSEVLIVNTVKIPVILLVVFLVMLNFLVVLAITSFKQDFQLNKMSSNNTTTEMDGKFLYSLIGMENHYLLSVLPGEFTTPSWSQIGLQFLTNVSLDDPRSLLGRELPSFSIYDSQIIVAGEGTNYTNLPIETIPPQPFMEAGKEAALQLLGHQLQ